MRQRKSCLFVIFTALLFLGVLFAVPTCFSQDNASPSRTVFNFYVFANDVHGAEKAISLLSPRLRSERSWIFEEIGKKGFCYIITRGRSIREIRTTATTYFHKPNSNRLWARVDCNVSFVGWMVYRVTYYLQKTEYGWQISVGSGI